ncbi:uncharacterized protein BP5553_01358 [Venustampulla echinocandica]|uniref:Vacuolar import and degradation protein 21 n=1 Tax=Venustampulla echinocandica TaxID=2656787 RepID=A0A370U0R9_9HELO|nr:uncharacterized protein BP5553_01358 [Venustampulla echinocandica]RDL41379.1 hypothetical protein BP5553_01358 [Venustampulla echinocandica]
MPAPKQPSSAPTAQRRLRPRLRLRLRLPTPRPADRAPGKTANPAPPAPAQAPPAARFRPVNPGFASVFSKNGCRGRFIMSEVGAADRSRLLRSKRTELRYINSVTYIDRMRAEPRIDACHLHIANLGSGIVTSRKRKLREFFAVCDTEGPLPQLTGLNLDAPPATPAEERFLDVSDILKDRLFDESNLPTRRQLRSNTLKQKSKSPSRKPSPDGRTITTTRKAKASRDGSRVRKSRASTPGARSDGGRTTPVVEIDSSAKALAEMQTPMERSASKGSQTELPAESSVVLDEIVEETFEEAKQPQPEMPDTVMSPKDLESDRIRDVLESGPNSPGVDPRKAMPISTDDSAQLLAPVNGITPLDPNHKAVTAHLPPKEVQERRLNDAEKARHEKEKARARLAINVSPDGARPPELLSSPGSTVGAQSATTPALHDASTDTSPDNESSRYDVDRLEKAEEPQTPPELKPTAKEVAEKEEHDRILDAQIEIARADILASSPTAADNQLRMEEHAASLNAADEQRDEALGDAEPVVAHETTDMLTKDAAEVVRDVVEDTAPAADTPADVDVVMSGVEVPSGEPNEPEAKQPEAKEPEVPDSDAASQMPAEAIEVDATTVKDSFESSEAIESKTSTSPAAPEQIETVEKPVVDSNIPSDTLPTSMPRKASSTPSATPTVERMTTRVSSGAMRHKSVSEILGEIPRPNTASISGRSLAKGATDSALTEYSTSPSRSSTPQSPGARIRTLIDKAKERERSKLSTVTFSRRPLKPGSNDTALMPAGSQAAKAPKEDYLKPLFIATATTDKRGIPALDSLLGSAHKTITTSNAYVPILESQTTKVLKRIYNLQSSNKWSLRQPKRTIEPNRPTTHWDVLLQEAKWMRTDFREERKWKMTVASNLASACAEWVSASPEDRLFLQVKAAPPTELPLPEDTSKDTERGNSSSQDASRLTPDLIHSGENDSSLDDFDEEPRLDLMETVNPTAIFGLQDDDVVFALRRSPMADKLLEELPMYGAPLVVPQSELPTSDLDPDRFWRRPALPLSKYVEGRMELKSEPPPKKRSRFEYDDEEDDDDEVVFGQPGHKRPILPPEQTDVALFNPEHKHILDRMHSLHQFRPPSEFPMPLQSFFETRVASQWTWDEDNELQTLVREYSYNWSLISSMLTSKSMFSSGAERRTPWECFERWIHLEGLPPDMQKTHYFRAYTTRIEAANRNVTAQAQAHAQATAPQAGANGQIQPPPKRRTTGSVRVERRRNQKHLTLVDAMRKLAKKRETSIQKQAQAAGMAALRKANENNHTPQRGPIHTPQDFSRIKHEREEQLRERMMLMQQRQEAQKRAQRNAAQNPQQGGIPPGGPQARGMPSAGGPMAPNGTPNVPGQNLTVPGQNRQPRPMPQMGQPMPNGLRVPQLPMNGMSPSPMQAMQGQMPMPNPAVSVGLINQAARTAEEQRAMIQMQQQGKLPGQSPQIHNSPPRMNGMPQPGFQMQNMMAFNANANGIPTPPINGVVPSSNQGHGQAGSPRIGQQHPHSQESQNTHIARLEAHFKKQYPNATQDQIMALMTDALKRNVQSKQGLAQSAMNAAAGAGTPMGGMNGQGPRMPVGVESSPQLYAQMLRQQQENQQKAEQARQAANIMAVAQAQSGGVTSNGQQGQGHAHRNSSGSVQSSK